MYYACIIFRLLNRAFEVEQNQATSDETLYIHVIVSPN
jgi:hypothetical protein